MKIDNANDYNHMSELAATLIIETIASKPNSLLCLATGETPLKTYHNIYDKYVLSSNSFRDLRILKLDEWCDMSMTNEATCERYLREHVVKPLNIDESRYIGFRGDVSNIENECSKIETYLDANGPIDLTILGLGANGHIGLIEPDGKLLRRAHKSKLTGSTKQHAMLLSSNISPSYGITLGIADIFNSKKIMLLVTGKNKNKIYKQLMSGDISTRLPASLLWLHPNVTMIVDKSSIKDF